MIILNEVLDNETIDLVCRYMLKGYAVLIKTDTTWGIMALQPNIIYEIKRRPLDKKIIKLIGPNFRFGNLTTPQKMFIRKFWPGSVTIIINGESYRLTNKRFINILISRLGSFVYCSSANISGGDPITTIEEALTVFAHDVDKMIMLAPIKEDMTVYENPHLDYNHNLQLASTIVDIDYWYIVRAGAKYFEVLNYISNEIIPYYQKIEKDILEYEQSLLIEVAPKKVVNYEGTPIIDIVRGLTPAVRKWRKKQIELLSNQAISSEKIK